MSDVKIDLMDVEGVIEQDIRNGGTQNDVAKSYALGLRSSWPTKWLKVNKMILDRWSPSGLEKIKTLAHSGKCFESPPT